MRTVVLTAAATAAALVGGAAIYRILFKAAPVERTWVVATYTGGVEVSTGAGGWSPAAMKGMLHDGDHVRTGADGEVTLVHDDSHVTVRSGTEVEVSQLLADQSRFHLAVGEVSVEARGDHVTMDSPGGSRVDAVDAGLGMTVLPDGWTQVEVKRGSADFTGMDQTERVGQGQKAHAAAGSPPSAPVAIPSVILSNVHFPDAETFRSRLARVEGKADPGARVTVGGQPVAVAADGTFTADVPLVEGVNQIEVAATDSVGNTGSERSGPIRVDTTAPSLVGATIGSRAVGRSSS